MACGRDVGGEWRVVEESSVVRAGVKWWLIDAGGELAREKVATQTVKLTLKPALFDENGNEVELLIDAAEEDEDLSTRDDGDEQLLDAPD
ncbi:MAG TPA: trypco2 family protein [Mycobacterium sp.]|nr:trypco2 family protein [Mycobacterium sp.]